MCHLPTNFVGTVLANEIMAISTGVFGEIISLRQLALAPVSFVVLVACLLLVCVRAWSEISEQALTNRARYLVNTVTLTFVVLLIALTLVRFKALA